MSTEFFNDQWRIPSNENQSKQSNYSFYGDGSGEINASSVPLSLESWTISVWLKPNITEQTKIIWNMEYPGAGGFKLIHQYGGSGSGTTAVWFQYYAPSFNEFSSQVTVTKDNWHHVIVRYNKGVDYRIYIDGILSGIKTGATVTYTWPATRNLEIFKAGGFNGSLNQFCVFNYALSDTSTTVGNTATGQVATLYNGTALANPMALSPKPVAYYKLGDQSVSTGTNANYLIPNNSLQDYVFETSPSGAKRFNIPSLPIASAATISIWFNPRTLVNATLFGGPSIGVLRLTGQNAADPLVKIVYCANNSCSVLETDITVWDPNTGASTFLNKWHHIALVQNGGVARVYIDNVDKGNASGSLRTPSFTNIGSENSASVFDGFVSNAATFTTNLPATGTQSIASLYNNGSPPDLTSYNNLQRWYKLNAADNFNATAPYFTTEWNINQAEAAYQSSSFCPNVNLQPKTDYLQVSNYSGTTGKSAASWSFWYNALESNNQGGPLSGTVAVFARNNAGQYAGMEFTLYTEVAGVDKTFSTKTTNFGGRYMDMPAAGNNTSIQGIGNWVNIVLVYDGSDPVSGQSELGSIKAYANGAQGFVPGSGNPYNGKYPAEGTIKTGNLVFGGGEFGPTRHMSASLSNYATWDKALTQAEVNEIVNGGQPKDLSTHSASSNLISWWTLENLTTGLVDTIGGYDASIVGSNSYVKKQSVSQLNGTSVGMTSANLVQSDLQHTSGYSPYALSFAADDSIEIPTNTNLEITGNITISAWIKSSSSSLVSTKIINKRNASSSNFDFFLDTGGKKLKFYDGTNNTASDITITLGIWNHVAITIRSGVTNGSVFYINGIGDSTILPTFTIASNTAPLVIGANFTRNGTFFNGDISNVSIFNYNLSPAEITEIYNQGVPSNLNTFSGTAPVGWWQLGSNSSFSTNWTVLDEIGTSNGVSTNMTNDDIVNGPGYSANGIGTNTMSIVNDAPYSTANGLSENMDVLDRVSGTGNVPG